MSGVLSSVPVAQIQNGVARVTDSGGIGGGTTGRRGVPSRPVVPPPIPPESVTLATPFWIWATGTDDSTPDILPDQHYEPGNSWAKLVVSRDTDYLAFYELYFYFLWQN